MDLCKFICCNANLSQLFTIHTEIFSISQSNKNSSSPLAHSTLSASSKVCLDEQHRRRIMGHSTATVQVRIRCNVGIYSRIIIRVFVCSKWNT